MKRPRLSVIVPVTVPGHRPCVLDSLNGCDGNDEIEVLVVSGRCPARQRNEAARQAGAEVLYLLDDDSWVEPDTLRDMIAKFEEFQMAALGGPALTRETATFFERCCGEVMASRCGAGVTRARATPVGEFRKVKGEELVSCNLMLSRSWFERLDGFDEALYPGEDVDLLKRLRNLGAPMYYDPQARVSRRRRQTPLAVARQFFKYAQGRGLRLIENFQPEDLLFLLPSALVLYLTLLPLLPAQPLLLYALPVLAESVRIGKRFGSLQAALISALTFPLIHLSYGLGMLAGVLRLPMSGKGQVGGVQIYRFQL